MKKRQSKKGRPSPLDIKRIRRTCQQLYTYRYVPDEPAAGPLLTQYGFRGIVDQHKKSYIHDVALALPLHWHCITITFIEDALGRRRDRLFGFARSNQAIRAEGNGIVPLLEAALYNAEEGLDQSLVYARAMIAAPWSKEFSSLVPIARKHAPMLNLVDADIDGIRDFEELKQETWLYDPTDVDDIDRRIARLMS